MLQKQVIVLSNRFEIHHTWITSFLECLVLVQNVGDAATHSSSEVPSGRANDDDASAGHVLATMVTNCFHNGMGSTIANCKAFAGNTANKKFTTRCSIECDVPNDNVVLGSECALFISVRLCILMYTI